MLIKTIVELNIVILLVMILASVFVRQKRFDVFTIIVFVVMLLGVCMAVVGGVRVIFEIGKMMGY